MINNNNQIAISWVHILLKNELFSGFNNKFTIYFIIIFFIKVIICLNILFNLVKIFCDAEKLPIKKHRLFIFYYAHEYCKLISNRRPTLFIVFID